MTLYIRENNTIGRLKGILVEKNPSQVVIDVSGVGYEVDVSMQTFYRLSTTGEAVQLYTQLVAREGAHLLFGFAVMNERATSCQLVKVSGIDAKAALGILSIMGADELVQVVAEEDVKRLSSAPGIGKKIAERMVLGLRGELVSTASDDPTALSAAVDRTDDIISTPLALGYSEREAKATVKGLPKGTDVGEGVWLALKNLLKQAGAV